MKIKRRQANSKKCIVCGLENPEGLKARFYSMEDDSCVALFRFNELNQSYPSRTHGGMVTAILDETIGRAIWCKNPEIWGVTMKINVEFHQPAPYDEDLICVGKITKETGFTFEGMAELYDKNFKLLDRAYASYFKLSLKQATLDGDCHKEDLNVQIEDDLKEIILPGEDEKGN